jgi:predicted RNA-binding Zn-ribbon protein involved in translation (DUF1610 family)
MPQIQCSNCGSHQVARTEPGKSRFEDACDQVTWPDTDLIWVLVPFYFLAKLWRRIRHRHERRYRCEPCGHEWN